MTQLLNTQIKVFDDDEMEDLFAQTDLLSLIITEEQIKPLASQNEGKSNKTLAATGKLTPRVWQPNKHFFNKDFASEMVSEENDFVKTEECVPKPMNYKQATTSPNGKL